MMPTPKHTASDVDVEVVLSIAVNSGRLKAGIVEDVWLIDVRLSRSSSITWKDRGRVRSKVEVEDAAASVGGEGGAVVGGAGVAEKSVGNGDVAKVL